MKRPEVIKMFHNFDKDYQLVGESRNPDTDEKKYEFIGKKPEKTVLIEVRVNEVE